MKHLGTLSEALSIVTRESLSLTTAQGSLSLCVSGVAVSTITAGNIVSMLASTPVNRATADASGNNIASTYVTAVGVSGNNLTWTKNGVANSLTVPYATNAGSLGGIAAADYLLRRRIANPDTYSTEVGKTPFNVFAYKGSGKPIYTDPEFASGKNSVATYNNSTSTGTVTITRGTYSSFNLNNSGNSSGYVLKITAYGSPTPGNGGFFQTIDSKSNGVFVQIFRALIPTGYTVQTASNSMGASYQDKWITDNVGTGKWEWYGRIVHCGNGGNFSSGGHVYLAGEKGTESNPIVWYLSYCNVIDVTSGNYDGLRTRLSDSADTAAKLTNARTIWGQTFDGTANVNGNFTTNGTITMNGTTKRIYFGTHYLELTADGYLHTDVGFYSDSFVSSGGIGQGGSGGGSTSVNVKSYASITTLSGSESLMDVPSAYAAKQIYDLANSAKSAINGIYNSSTQTLSVGSIVASGGLLTLGHGSITDDQGGMTLSTDEGSINLNSDVYASGNVGIGTAPASSYKLAVNGTVHATVFDGKLGTATKGAANLPIYLNAGTPTPVTSLAEAYLSWGGKNFSGSYGPIDAAMVPVLGANRSAFAKAAGITVEYSRDGGTTWTDYGAADTTKTGLFSGISAGFSIGKADSSHKATASYKLRVTLSTSAAGIYTVLNKFVIYLSTNGSTGCTCTITARLQSNYEAAAETWVTFADKAPVSGWSGFNVINTSGITTYGNTKASQYGQIRFLFECTGGSETYTGLQLQRIYCFGGVGWTTPSTMAATGDLYAYDASQNATFPAQVTANGGAVIKGGGSVVPLILKGGLGSYREGLRIMATNSWSDILLAGTDADEASGTSVNSWFIGNNNGNFYITRNGSASSSSAMLSCVSNAWSLSGNVSIGGTLTANGINIGSGCLAMSKTNGQLDIANDSEWSGVKVWKPVTLGSTINGYELSTAESPYFKISRSFTGTDGQVHSAYIATNTSRTLGNACEAAKDTAMSQTSSDSYLPTSKAVATYLSDNYIRKTGGTLTGKLHAHGGIYLDSNEYGAIYSVSGVGLKIEYSGQYFLIGVDSEFSGSFTAESIGADAVYTQKIDFGSVDDYIGFVDDKIKIASYNGVDIVGSVKVDNKEVKGSNEYNLTSIFGQSVGSSVGAINGKNISTFLSDIANGTAKMYCQRAVTLNGTSYNIRTDVFVMDRNSSSFISLYYDEDPNGLGGDIRRNILILASNTSTTLKIQDKGVKSL